MDCRGPGRRLARREAFDVHCQDIGGIRHRRVEGAALGVQDGDCAAGTPHVHVFPGPEEAVAKRR